MKSFLLGILVVVTLPLWLPIGILVIIYLSFEEIGDVVRGKDPLKRSNRREP